MLSTLAYNPALHDLFLYEDHTVTWTVPTSGSAVVKRPYAWNPNSIVYGYRRSLEGIVATYRTFSTDFGPASSAPEVDAVNPKANIANKPMWFNSFPPTSKVISNRMMHWCSHCYGFDAFGIAERTDGALLNTLYTPDSYLDAILNLRFIDGDNNIVVIPKTQCERPYVYDSPNGITPLSLASVGSPYRHDVAACVLLTDFPFTPLTCLDSGSIPAESTWIYVNAGNLFAQEIDIRAMGFRYDEGPSGANANWRGNHALYRNFYDQAFLHDSGSLFLHPIKPPTSAEAGDGVMGVAMGHILFGPPYGEGSQVWKSGTPPFQVNGVTQLPLRQPAFPRKVDANWNLFMNYWTARGFPFPTLQGGSFTTTQTPITQTQVLSMQTTVAAMRSSSFT